MRWEVGCELGFDVDEHVAMAVQVAVASTAGSLELEEVVATLDGQAIEAEAVAVDVCGRVHLIRCGRGRLTFHYRAVLLRSEAESHPVSAGDELIALRQSRYCPSDTLDGFAEIEFGKLAHGPDRARAIADWVFDRIHYEFGSSGPLDTAVDTLLAGRGVCRDFAHLTIALCRAVGVPARLVSVYAPGLSPMDFHAVAEVAVDGRWEVVDATKLAPRQSLLRIATGRDAADTAFATTFAGSAELVSSMVEAWTDGDLPLDDHTGAVTLA